MTKLKKALKLTLILILVALALVCGAIVVFGGFEALAAVFLILINILSGVDPMAG